MFTYATNWFFKIYFIVNALRSAGNNSGHRLSEEMIEHFYQFYLCNETN